MLKQEARKMYRQQRDAMSDSEKMKWDDLLLIQFQTVELPFVSKVLSFYPIEEYREVNSFPVTDYLHFRNPGLTLCYPRTHRDTSTMDAVICYPDTIFEENQWNIPEPRHTDTLAPAELDLVIVPLLACDLRGVRVGYGKGFYDRFLKECRPDCIRMGFSYFQPVEEISDAADFDVPLDFCITPDRVYVF